MSHYLAGGWYAPGKRARLKTEVVDGAMDAAGMLMRAGVPPHRVLRIALKVRSLVVIADPLLRGGEPFTGAPRQRLADRLAVHTDGFPELQSFILDCLDHVASASDMTAFYLHLLHVGRMMQLIGHAVGTGLGGALLGAPRAHERAPKRKAKAAPRRPRRSATGGRSRPARKK